MKPRKQLWTVFGMVSLIALAGLFIGCPAKSNDDDNNNSGQDKWTVMLYGAGNNDLDQANNGTSYIVQDVQDMEKVGSQDGVNMIAMVSRFGGGGNARYYEIGLFPSENPNQISSTELENLGTKDMSDPQTLKNFINYCKQNYPADRYQLIIDDHGAGWPGSCSDELSGAGGLLTIPETREAIATSELGSVDILTWHACLMGMAEVAYELRTVCEYMTSCQFVMPMENILGADIWLDWLVDNKDASTENYAREVVEGVITRAQFKQKTTHYALIKMSEMQNLGAALGTFGNILISEGGAHWDEVLNAWNTTHATDLDEPTYVDIREFTNNIQAQPNLANSNLINSNAVAVRNALNAAVPFTDTYFQSPTQPVPRGGLNVYIPWRLDQFSPDSVSYSSLQWRQTNWHAFISTFVRSLGVEGAIGACCYDNNTECAEGATQEACQALGGVWHQDQTCAQVCGGGGECIVACDAAHPISVGTPFGCSIPAEGLVTWMSITLTFPAAYRFQLTSAAGNDYDFRMFGVDCETDANCYGEEIGDEDVTCDGQTPGVVNFKVGILAYTGSGPFTFLVTQISVTDGETKEMATK